MMLLEVSFGLVAIFHKNSWQLHSASRKPLSLLLKPNFSWLCRVSNVLRSACLFMILVNYGHLCSSVNMFKIHLEWLKSHFQQRNERKQAFWRVWCPILVNMSSNFSHLQQILFQGMGFGFYPYKSVSHKVDIYFQCSQSWESSLLT